MCCKVFEMCCEDFFVCLKVAPNIVPVIQNDSNRLEMDFYDKNTC
jgi:hypothetical protein